MKPTAEQYRDDMKSHVDQIMRELKVIKRIQKNADANGYCARCDFIAGDTKLPARCITSIGVSVKEYPQSPAAAQIEDMLNNLAAVASKYGKNS